MIHTKTYNQVRVYTFFVILLVLILILITIFGSIYYYMIHRNTINTYTFAEVYALSGNLRTVWVFLYANLNNPYISRQSTFTWETY